MIWTPHVTVASVIEQHGHFLLVQERESGRTVLNQPAGHLEDGESLVAAVIRETLEETGWHFRPVRDSATMPTGRLMRRSRISTG